MWDYHVSSVPVYINNGPTSHARTILEYMGIAMLALNIISEVFGPPPPLRPVFDPHPPLPPTPLHISSQSHRLLPWLTAGIPDIIDGIRHFTLLQYLQTPSNVLDWTHFAMMITGWVYWYAYVDKTARFTMEPGYAVLSSPTDQTPARLLLTNAEEEARFLRFSQDLSALSESLRMYTNIASICGASPAQLSPHHSLHQ